jgi:hypothetical protein
MEPKNPEFINMVMAIQPLSRKMIIIVVGTTIPILSKQMTITVLSLTS